jgi:L-aminopeptidase/D-esterase-like protein
LSDPHLSTPAGKPRARALGIPFDGRAGPWNAITDVPGVCVGYATLVAGEGPLVVGRGPVRTGVTAILPRPAARILDPVFAGFYSQNGNGEMTGTHMVEEVGAFTLPVTITNTHACGIARDATIDWINRTQPGKLDDAWGLPVAAETYDGFLNDINGGHVRAADVMAAIDAAASGPVEEGSVGGGTGMICLEFKGGSGTASRRVAHAAGEFILAAFVQANFGRRRNLVVRGRHLGAAFAEPALVDRTPLKEKSSIIGVIATDAPLLPHQLKRLARRAPLGVALTGGYAYHSSGDIFLAFSTANGAALTAPSRGIAEAAFLSDASLDPFFDAVVQTTEEAILNTIVANADMTGRDGNFVPAIPHDRLAAAFD